MAVSPSMLTIYVLILGLLFYLNWMIHVLCGVNAILCWKLLKIHGILSIVFLEIFALSSLFDVIPIDWFNSCGVVPNKMSGWNRPQGCEGRSSLIYAIDFFWVLMIWLEGGGWGFLWHEEMAIRTGDEPIVFTLGISQGLLDGP